MKIANRWNEEIYVILFVKEAWTSYLRKSTHKVGEHFKKCVNKNSFDLLLILLISLEKQTENSGVLLNWQNSMQNVSSRA